METAFVILQQLRVSNRQKKKEVNFNPINTPHPLVIQSVYFTSIDNHNGESTSLWFMHCTKGLIRMAVVVRLMLAMFIFCKTVALHYILIYRFRYFSFISGTVRHWHFIVKRPLVWNCLHIGCTLFDTDVFNFTPLHCLLFPVTFEYKNELTCNNFIAVL